MEQYVKNRNKIEIVGEIYNQLILLYLEIEKRRLEMLRTREC